MIVTLQRDNVEGIVRRDNLVGNLHSMEVILIDWKVFFGLCKLLFLQYHCDDSEQDFFSLVKN